LIPFEPLDDVDDEEIEGVILNEEEVKIKTQVWMELNKEYLQEQEGTFPFFSQRCQKCEARSTLLIYCSRSFACFPIEKRARIEMEKKMGIYNTKKGVSIIEDSVNCNTKISTTDHSMHTFSFLYIAQEGQEAAATFVIRSRGRQEHPRAQVAPPKIQENQLLCTGHHGRLVRHGPHLLRRRSSNTYQVSV
jgi:hypothetical protein